MIMKKSGGVHDSAYQVLKNEIEETFGKKIGISRDCVLLSEEVYAKISDTVNSNTLRRFFGLIKSVHSPSSTTLDILSRYCGFASFDEFKKLKNNTSHINNEDYYSQSILKYLGSLFKSIPVREHGDRTFMAIVENTIYFLQRHTELIDKFQRDISKTVNGQHYYFEQFINIDELNSFYGDGLRYYLNEKKTAEAQIFGHSLLCLREWFIENPAGVKKHHDEVMGYQLTKAMHPALCGRYFAAQLYCAEIHGLPLDKIIATAQNAHVAIRQKADHHRIFPYFEYVISPALFLTGHPEDALYYINYSLDNYPHKDASVEHGFHQTMYLIKALVFARTGKKQEAEKLYRQVHPAKFYFLTKKTNTIMYLFLNRLLNKNDASSDQQLKDLVAETGFTRVNKAVINANIEQ